MDNAALLKKEFKKSKGGSAVKENRTGEGGQPPPRSSRIFNMEDYWYFATREGADIGPYDSRDAAYDGLENFIRFLQLAGQQTLRNFLSALSLSDSARLRAG